MSNMFDNAKKTEAKPAKKGKGKQKRQVQVKGLTQLASIKAVLAALEGMAKTTEAEIKAQMSAQFVKEGCAIGRRPENFEGVDVGSTASCQIRKRSSRSVLTEGEVELLEANAITYETIDDVEDTFVINPAYAGDSDLLGKVSKKLEGIKGLPEDFIQHQEGKSRRVATDASVEQIFTLPAEDASELLDVVTTLAIRPKLDSADLKGALARISKAIK